MINFLNLKYFLAVVEEMNITRAAERLYISQQSLSNHIGKLEKELGAQLFMRTPHLQLTYAGTRLVAAAAGIMDIERQLHNELEDIRSYRRGQLRIGVSHTRGRAILPELLPSYQSHHPLVDISLLEGNSLVLEENLQHGKIDLLIGFTPVMLEMIKYEELLKERLFLVAPRQYLERVYGEESNEMRRRFKTELDIMAFRNFPFLMLKRGNHTRTLFDEYLARNGIRPRILLETENIETAFALSVRGMGVTVYPEMFLKTLNTIYADSPALSVDLFPINDKETLGTLIIGFRKEQPLSLAAQAFIRLAKERMRKQTEIPESS